MSQNMPMCGACKHLLCVPGGCLATGAWACDAFPLGIPHGILASGWDHREPYDGDHRIQFELADAHGVQNKERTIVRLFVKGPSCPMARDCEKLDRFGID